MLRFAILFALLLTQVAAWAISPNEQASLYQHLMDVNAQWERVTPTGELLKTVHFATDQQRIQSHLLQVERSLRDNTPANIDPSFLGKREHLLDVLHDYALAGRFPQNYDFDHRIPYFIDAHNTACAVGYLMIADGQQALANKISHTNNYQYLLDMSYPELNEWVATSGFTAQDLAWIQPGYLPSRPYTKFAESSGTNGKVNKLFVDATTDRVYIAGQFSMVDSMPGYNNIALYDNGTWNNMNGGLNGEVHTVAVYNNAIYFGGAFTASTDGVSSAGVIKWDGSNWSSVDLFGLYGTVYALQVYNNKLYVGGDYEIATALIRGYLLSLDGSLPELLPQFPMGPVHSICIFNGQLAIGGSFTELNDLAPANNLLLMDSTTSLTDVLGGFNNPVMALTEYRGKLMVGGAQTLLTDDTLSCLAYYHPTSGWNDRSLWFSEELNHYPDLDTIKDFLVYDGELYLSGSFNCCEGFDVRLISGHDIATLDIDDEETTAIEFVGYFGGSSINTMSLYRDTLIVGGLFYEASFTQHLTGRPYYSRGLGNIAKAGGFDYTSIAPANATTAITLYPNPANDRLYIDLEAMNGSASNIKISNGCGQVVHEQLTDGTTLEIMVNDQAAGLYLLQVYDSNGRTLAIQKFIVE